MPTFIQDEKLGTKVPLIKTADINDKSITKEKLAEGSVTNSKLAPESVTQDKFDKELLQIFEAASGLPENLIETIQNIDSTLVNHQRQISSNDDDISDLQTKTKQIEDTVDGIAVSGGASVGSAVTYDNTQSGLDALNIQNAIDELVNNLGHYETNEEWLRVYTDAENKFLWGIRVDGSIDWAIGIPRPIQKKIEELIATDTVIQESITQLRTELTESLNKKIQSLKDNEIKNLQDTKVDKEEGKSLIEDEVKECFKVIENEEFIKAVVDSEDRVLYGIYRDTGKPYYPQNDMYHISHSEEFLWVILDAANHPLIGIKEDGTCWAAKAQWLDDIKAIKKALSSIDETLKAFQPKEDGRGLINIDIADSFFYISNDEYIIAIVDAEDRILAGIKYDGEPYFPNHEMYSVITNEEWLYAIIDAEDKVLGGFRANDGHMIVGGIDISTFITNAIIDIADIKERTNHLSTIENDEYLSVETDAEGKVLSATNPDGSHYIHNAKSETIPDEFSHIEDPEGRTEITTDAEGKVLGYRDSEGTRHECSLDVNSLKVSNKDVEDLIHDSINEIKLANINGIENHGKENLYTGYTQRYTTADGKQTFVSPNESLGGVFCNPIRCSAGEYFTRTGIATAIVVVSDKNDNNAQRVYQGNGSLPGNTFQIPTNWDWAYYLRCVCMSTDKELAIMRGKYAVKKSEQDGKLRIPDMKLSIANFTKETKYISSPNGTMYEIAVDNDGQLYAKEIDKDVIFPSDIPSNFKFTLVNNLTNGEKLPFNRFITNIDSYVGAWSANGLVAYKDLSPVTLNANWEYHKNSNGEGRYMCINGYNAQGFPKGFSVYDEDFKMIDNVEGNFDNHDYIYIDDGHYILFYESAHQVTIRGEKHTTNIPTLVEYKNGKILAQRLLNDEIIMNDLGPSNYYMSETHVNAIGFDGDDESRIIINPRHCMAFYILERNVSSDGSVSFGEVIAQVGGLHSLNNYNISSRIKTEEECQWFLCHDVKKWGEKSISGKSYPVYTLFDNNTYDNQGLNPNNTKNNKPSRIIQMAIDFENKEIVEYKIYQIEEYKSDIMSSAFMFDEGKIFIDYARQPICGYYDFTTEATTVIGNSYTGARKVIEFKSGTNTPYRVYPFNV